MAHIPMGDITTLWNESNNSWQGLENALQQHKGTSQGISENLIDMMIPEVKDLERSGESFPTSADQLSQVLNQRLDKYEQQGENLDHRSD